MIVCRNCGHSNPDGTAWCQKPGCGAFLEFDGDPQNTQQVPTVPDTQPSGPPPTRSAPPAPSSAPTVPDGNPVMGPPARPATNTGAARPMVRQVPSPATTSADTSALARQPGTPVPPPPPAPVASAPASDIPPIRPGDVICPVCGWGNEPTRNFCRHDGAVLPRPGGTPPPGGVLKAGERPAGAGGGRSGILVALAVLAVVAVVVLVGGYLYLTHRNDGPGNVAGPNASPSPTLVLIPVPAADITVSASSYYSVPGAPARPPKAVLDGNPSTFWSAGYQDSVRRLRFEFGKTQTIQRIDILNGAAGKGFLDRPSPRKITLKFADGTQQTTTLADQHDTLQPIVLDVPHRGKWIELTVNTYFDRTPRPNSQMYRRPSISEVSFFTVPTSTTSATPAP